MVLAEETVAVGTEMSGVARLTEPHGTFFALLHAKPRYSTWDASGKEGNGITVVNAKVVLELEDASRPRKGQVNCWALPELLTNRN